MEVPDVLPWVRPGEFLVTTGYVIRENPSILVELIPQLEKRNVAALGIKTHRFIDKIPATVIAIADQWAFPVIELGPETSFSDVVRIVMERILGSETAVVKTLQIRIQSLTHHLMSKVGKEEMLDIVEEIVGNPVALVYQNKFTFSTSAKESLQPHGDDLLRICNELTKKDGYPTLVRLNNRTIRVYSAYCGDFDETSLKLLVFDMKQSFSPLDLLTFEQFAPLIGLQWVNVLAHQKIESVHRDTFLREWITGSIKETLEVVSRSKVCGYRHLGDGPYSIIVVRFLHETPDTEKLVRIVEDLRYPLECRNLLATTLDGSMVIIAVEYDDHCLSLCKDILENRLKQHGSPIIQLCIGRPVSSLSQITDSYQEALRSSMTGSCRLWTVTAEIRRNLYSPCNSTLKPIEILRKLQVDCSYTITPRHIDWIVSNRF